MIDAKQIDHFGGYSVELYKKLMTIQWHVGGIHKNVELSVNPLHKFVFRSTFGRGLEAINSDRLRPKYWCANELQYFAPNCEYLHTTEMASDWLVINLTDDIFDTILEKMDVNIQIRVKELEEYSFDARDLSEYSWRIRSYIVNHSQTNPLDFEGIVAEFIYSA